MRRELVVFYDLSAVFDDDERIMAFAIYDHVSKDIPPEDIYKDLLSCRYKKWNASIQKAIDSMSIDRLKEYIDQKQFELDMMNSHFWSCGDTAMIEKAGWKIGNGTEDEA